MKVLNFGSLNLDYVYAVGDHFVKPGKPLVHYPEPLSTAEKG